MKTVDAKKEYEQSPKGLTTRKKYNKSKIGRDTKKKYEQSIKGKATRKNPISKMKHSLRREVGKKYREQLIKAHPFCEKCKSTENLEVHHEVYSNDDLTRLKVYCRKCHRELHKKLISCKGVTIRK